MDPLVDKIMMAAAFISLVPLEAIPAWAATTVVARDFLITGLRLMASARGQILPAERLGKHKTSWQIITVIFFLVLLSARELKYAERRRRLVVSSLESGRADPGLDRGGLYRLFRASLRLAPSRRHRAGSVADHSSPSGAASSKAGCSTLMAPEDLSRCSHDPQPCPLPQGEGVPSPFGRRLG